MQPDAWDQSPGHRTARTVAAVFLVFFLSLLVLCFPFWGLLVDGRLALLSVGIAFTVAAVAAVVARLRDPSSVGAAPIVVFTALASFFGALALVLGWQAHDAT